MGEETEVKIIDIMIHFLISPLFTRNFGKIGQKGVVWRFLVG
jgi:hypothetical protein